MDKGKSRQYSGGGAFGKGRELTHLVRNTSLNPIDPNNNPHGKTAMANQKPDKKYIDYQKAKWRNSKVIVHLDMDAFFAAIEQQHCPELKDKPVIIGGPPEYRGVVATCSYEARAFGVKSAMSSKDAHRLCPNGIFLETDGAKYTYISVQILNILRGFSPTVEPFSIDEAFVDITGLWEIYGSPLKMVEAIKSEIKSRSNLTCSAGIGPNKIIAKMASKMDKPNGTTVIAPDVVPAFLECLPVEKIFGVGHSTKRTLEKLGVHTIGQLAETDVAVLTDIFGVNGKALHNIANGKGDTNVIPFYQRPLEKSIGHEMTLPRDTNSFEVIKANLRLLSERVGRRMRKSGLEAKRVTLKFRYFDFSTFTRAKTLSNHIKSDNAVFNQALLLLKANPIKSAPLRLIGVSVSRLREIEGDNRQLEIFDKLSEERAAKISQVMDKIKDNFGDRSITYLSTQLKYNY